MERPVFARPEEVVTFSDQAAFIAFLDQYHVPYHTWNDVELDKQYGEGFSVGQKLTELWNEVESGDAVYTTTKLIGDAFEKPLRFILTLSVRVVIKHPNLGMLVLVEFMRKGNFYVPRRHRDSSISEKIRLSRRGRPTESIVQAIRRCYLEEPEFKVARLRKNSLHFLRQPEQVLIGRARNVEQDVRGRNGMPGLKSFNQVAHYVSYLSHAHYFTGWRMDSNTRYLFCWRPVSGENTMLEPIPVELVLT